VVPRRKPRAIWNVSHDALRSQRVVASGPCAASERAGKLLLHQTANAKCLIFVLNAGAQRSDKARYCARLNDDLCGNGQRRQAAGVAASKVIRVPVPMAAFGGKADMIQLCSDVCF